MSSESSKATLIDINTLNHVFHQTTTVEELTKKVQAANPNAVVRKTNTPGVVVISERDSDGLASYERKHTEPKK